MNVQHLQKRRVRTGKAGLQTVPVIEMHAGLVGGRVPRVEWPVGVGFDLLPGDEHRLPKVEHPGWPATR